MPVTDQDLQRVLDACFDPLQQLHSRWQHERDPEALAGYGRILTPLLALAGATFVAMRPRPFWPFFCLGASRFQLKVTSRLVAIHELVPR